MWLFSPSVSKIEQVTYSQGHSETVVNRKLLRRFPQKTSQIGKRFIAPECLAWSLPSSMNCHRNVTGGLQSSLYRLRTFMLKGLLFALGKTSPMGIVKKSADGLLYSLL